MPFPQRGGEASRAAFRTGHWPLSTLPPFGQRQRLETQPPSVNKRLHSRYPHLFHVCCSHFEGGMWEPRLEWEGPEQGALDTMVCSCTDSPAPQTAVLGC